MKQKIDEINVGSMVAKYLEAEHLNYKYTVDSFSVNKYGAIWILSDFNSNDVLIIRRHNNGDVDVLSHRNKVRLWAKMYIRAMYRADVLK